MTSNWIRTLLVSSALVTTTLALSSAAEAGQCEGLQSLALRGIVLSSVHQDAQTLAPDPNSLLTGSLPKPLDVPSHCLVEGKIDDRQGVGGSYAIRFQLRIPDAWNGRFLFQGGGGLDGFLAPAVGSIPSLGSSAEPAIKRGYAVASMNGGHDGNTAEFAADQQARLDYAYAAIGKVTNAVKAILHAYAGREPDHSFFMGCSNGGREAMIAAQRYPTEFDGIIAGNPGFRLSAAAVAQNWDVRQLMAVAPDGVLSQALTQQDLDQVSSAVLDSCDALDGLKDGIINAHLECRFNLDSLHGKLATNKLDALKAVMAGPHDKAGKALYSPWPVDAGINSPGWRMWKLGTSPSAQQPNALNVIIGAPSLSAVFMTPPQAPRNPMALDFNKVSQQTAQMAAMIDATSTDLATFSARGGKMLIFQGLSDPVFSADDITGWYTQALADTKGDFARLFLVPGMTHCGGGPALDNFDPLTALESWVSTGKAPAEMVASGMAFPDKKAPLCPYPQEAFFTGKDPRSAESYTCLPPKPL